MELVVDLRKVEKRGPIEPGIYDVKVTDVTVGDTQNGNTMLTVKMEITTKGEYKGRTIRDHLVLSPSSMWKVYDALSALLGPQPLESIKLDTNALLGATAHVHITNRIWAVEGGGDGRPRPQVSSWIITEGEELLDEADIRL